jgi:hypothetical protein
MAFFALLQFVAAQGHSSVHLSKCQVFVHLMTPTQTRNMFMALDDKLQRMWKKISFKLLPHDMSKRAEGILWRYRVSWTIIEPGTPRVRGRNTNSIQLFGVLSENKFIVNMGPEFCSFQNILGYMESYIFWHITPCCLLKVNRRFGGTCCLLLHRKISSNNYIINVESEFRNLKKKGYAQLYILGCHRVFVESELMFRRNMSPPSSGSMNKPSKNHEKGSI